MTTPTTTKTLDRLQDAEAAALDKFIHDPTAENGRAYDEAARRTDEAVTGFTRQFAAV